MPALASDINAELIDAFGIEADFTSQSGTLVGIFDHGYDGGESMEYGGELPVFTILSGQGVTAADYITIDSTVYYVRQIEPDGDGLDVLRLESD